MRARLSSLGPAVAGWCTDSDVDAMVLARLPPLVERGYITEVVVDDEVVYDYLP